MACPSLFLPGSCWAIWGDTIQFWFYDFYYFGGRLFTVQLYSILSSAFRRLKTGHSNLVTRIERQRLCSQQFLGCMVPPSWLSEGECVCFTLHLDKTERSPSSALTRYPGEGSSLQIKPHSRAHSVLELAPSSRFHWCWPKSASTV